MTLPLARFAVRDLTRMRSGPTCALSAFGFSADEIAALRAARAV